MSEWPLLQNVVDFLGSVTSTRLAMVMSSRRSGRGHLSNGKRLAYISSRAGGQHWLFRLPIGTPRHRPTTTEPRTTCSTWVTTEGELCSSLTPIGEIEQGRNGGLRPLTIDVGRSTRRLDLRARDCEIGAQCMCWQAQSVSREGAASVCRVELRSRRKRRGSSPHRCAVESGVQVAALRKRH